MVDKNRVAIVSRLADKLLKFILVTHDLDLQIVGFGGVGFTGIGTTLVAKTDTVDVAILILELSSKGVGLLIFSL